MEKLRARTSAEKEVRRLKLLKSARTIFSENGFQGTKINMITEHAGLSPAAFYLYFKSKVEVYRLLSIDGTRILKDMISKALSSEKGDCVQLIKALSGAYFEFFLQEREYYEIISVHHLGQKVFFENMNLVPQLEALSLELLKILAEIIEEGIERKQLKKCDSWNTAVTLWGMMDGILLLEVRKTTGYTKTDINSLHSRFLELCLDALRV